MELTYSRFCGPMRSSYAAQPAAMPSVRNVAMLVAPAEDFRANCKVDVVW